MIMIIDNGVKQFTHLAVCAPILSLWQFTLQFSQCLGLQSKTSCPLVRNLFSNTMLPMVVMMIRKVRLTWGDRENYTTEYICMIWRTKIASPSHDSFFFDVTALNIRSTLITGQRCRLFSANPICPTRYTSLPAFMIEVLKVFLR